MGDQMKRYEAGHNIVAFLKKFAIATDVQLWRAMSPGRLTSQQNRSKQLKRYADRHVIKSRAGFHSKRVWMIDEDMIANVYAHEYSWISTGDIERRVDKVQNHTLAVSSLASQVLSQPKYDPVGIGQKSWDHLRAGLQEKRAWFLSEREINSMWQSTMGGPGAEAEVEWYHSLDAHNIAIEAKRAIINGDVSRYYLWRLATGDTLFNPNDANNRYIDASPFMTMDATGKQTLRADVKGYLLKDHPADGVIILSGADRNPERTLAIAVEMELHPKSLTDYVKTLAAYQSELGRALFSKVIWYCSEGFTMTQLQRAVNIVGNDGNQIVLKRIEPAYGFKSYYVGTDIQLADTKSLEMNEPTNGTNRAAERRTRRVPTITAPTNAAPSPDDTATVQQQRPANVKPTHKDAGEPTQAMPKPNPFGTNNAFTAVRQNDNTSPFALPQFVSDDGSENEEDEDLNALMGGSNDNTSWMTLGMTPEQKAEYERGK